MRIPESAIEIGVVIFAVRFIGGEAVFERASRRGDIRVFRPVLGLRLLFGIGIALILLTMSEEGIKSSTLLSDVLALGVIIIIVVVFPGTIFVDPTSILENRWFGLKRTQIPWNEVSFAGDDAENITVRSKDDHIIRHTKYHVDRRGFIAALKQYCEVGADNYPTP